jgi:prepilin-type N-terminal cleavage/methylation domain-containing protein/prepilin-type processing-associated H-X9-DG protein
MSCESVSEPGVSRSVRKRFTLVELLVVIAVIAILSGLLFSSIRKARERAKGISCVNNLSQLAKANASYSVDYGYNMPTYASGMSGPSQPGKLWIGYRLDSTTMDLSRGFMGEYLAGGVGREAGPGLIDSLICPGWRVPIPDKHAADKGAGYGHNSYGVGTWTYASASRKDGDGQEIVGAVSPTAIKSDTYPAGNTFGAGLNVGKMKKPSQTVVFTDACTVLNATSLQAMSFVYPKFSYDGVSALTRRDNVHFRHAGLASVAWVDGHVTTEKPTRLYSSEFARKELIGNFGPDDNSLYEPF